MNFLNFEFFFYIFITIDSINFIFFIIFFVIFIFLVIFLVHLCIILVRNGMFYEKHKSSYKMTIYYYVIDILYIYSWKKIDKKLIDFGDALCKYIYI